MAIRRKSNAEEALTFSRSSITFGVDGESGGSGVVGVVEPGVVEPGVGDVPPGEFEAVGLVEGVDVSIEIGRASCRERVCYPV